MPGVMQQPAENGADRAAPAIRMGVSVIVSKLSVAVSADNAALAAAGALAAMTCSASCGSEGSGLSGARIARVSKYATSAA